MVFIQGQVIAFPKDRASCRSLRALPLVWALLWWQLCSQI